MGSFDYSDDYSSFDNLLDRTTLLTEGGKGLGRFHPGFGKTLTSRIRRDAGSKSVPFRSRKFVVHILYTMLKPAIITSDELSLLESDPKGPAGKSYNLALQQILDNHKDEITQRADEISDAIEERFSALANEIMLVAPKRIQGNIDAAKAQEVAKEVTDDIKRGEKMDDSVEDALGKMLVQAGITKVLYNIQTSLGEPGLDIEEEALQQVIDYVDRIETVDQLSQFVKQITPLPGYQKIAFYLSGIIKPLRGIKPVEEEEGPYEADQPGGPAGAYAENETGQNISEIEDEEDVISRESLNNNMRKRKLLFEKKKNWGRFRSNTKERLVVEKDLDAAERRALPNKDFALPGKGKGPEGKQAGSYPIPDESHARSALSLVSQHGTPEEKKRVRAAVARKFPGIKQEDEEEEVRVDLQRGPMLDSYQSDTSGYLSEQVTKDKRNKKSKVKNQSFKERYKPKTHWQLQELRRMGL